MGWPSGEVAMAPELVSELAVGLPELLLELLRVPERPALVVPELVVPAPELLVVVDADSLSVLLVPALDEEKLTWPVISNWP